MGEEKICIIPAYEPDGRLIPLVKEAKENNFRVICVDDGSGIKYKELFDEAAEYAEIISYEVNGGKGHAMKKAFSYVMECLAKNSSEECFLVIVDCDGQHKIEDAERIIEEAKKDPEALILGSRKQSKESPLRSRFGNAVTRNVFKLVSGVKIYDTQTGMRGFSSRLLPDIISVSGERYEYEMNMLLEFAQKGIPIKEVWIETIYFDNNSGSHFNTIKDSWRVYKCIFNNLFKFTGSSVLAFLVDYGCYSLLNLITGGGAALLSNIVARIISATTNYIVNKKYVFEDDKPISKSAPGYALVAVVILALNTALLAFLIKVLGMNIYVAKILVEIVLFFLSYTVQRKKVFRRNNV